MNAYSAMRKNELGEPRYWENGAHFQAWYPLCTSEALGIAQVLGRDFLGTRVVIYRDPLGNPIVQSGYCPHMGADLSDGEIVEGELRCPYHHWRFEKGGQCSQIPSGARPPRVARIFNYPVAEKWGLIWAFNGDEALYDVPTFDGPEEDYIFLARERPETIATDSWIQGTNGLDFQHLTAVHHFPAAAVPTDVRFGEFTIEYELPVIYPDGKNRMYAANCLVAHQTLPRPINSYVIFATNASKPGESVSFWVAAVKRAEGETRAQAEARLADLDEFLVGFFAEDEHILNKLRLRPHGEAKLIKEDVYLARFFEWLNRFPRKAPFDL